MTTIGTSTTLGINLMGPTYANPISIVSGVTISSSGLAIYAGAASGFWTIQNSGTVLGGSISNGIDLLAGGLIVNTSPGVITGDGDGIGIYDASGTVVNDGRIGGALGNGVALAAGGSVTNAASASITGYGDGVYIRHATGVLVNYGSIAGTSTIGEGAHLFQGGSVSNASGAAVSGTEFGVLIEVAAGTVANAGDIAGTSGTGIGVGLYYGGSVTNATSGSITGGADGVLIILAPGSVVNDGSIAGTGTAGDGIALKFGGVVSNGTSASIAATGDGVLVQLHAGSVINRGTIEAAGISTDGVKFEAGGSVINGNGGRISGWSNGIEVSGAAGTVINDGSILGSLSDGVFLSAGGAITNASTALISGYSGINIGSGTIVNLGSVAGPYHLGFGVILGSGGTMTNAVSGSVSGGYVGVKISSTGASVINYGVIGGRTAVDLEGGSITNAASAEIAGDEVGIESFAGGTLVNDGSITGTLLSGVYMADGGSVTNGISAIIANSVGVELLVGGTLINAGTIVGRLGTAVSLGTVGNNLLVVAPGAYFGGQVAGSASASNTLELASAASAGSLSGLGTDFTNFGSIVFDAGADWFIAGNTTGLAGTISGFAFGDTIEVTGITATGSSYSGGVLTLMEASGSVDLILPGSFTTSDFVINNNSATTAVDITLMCFRDGTRIRTLRGEVVVEKLRVGEPVLAHTGDGRMAPHSIVWIGHRSVDSRRHPKPTQVWPVRIRAGTFGAGQPARDLFLSPDHAVFVDGVLIPVKYLINGRGIAQVPVSKLHYFHVELSAHAVLLAEGLPVESYLNVGDRANFANGGEPVTLFPDFAARAWEMRGCAELVVIGSQVEAARALIDDDAAHQGSVPNTASG